MAEIGRYHDAYLSTPLEQKLAWFQGVPGLNAVEPAGRFMTGASTLYTASDTVVQKTMRNLGIGWSGDAAVNAGATLNLAAQWSEGAGATQTAGRRNVEGYGQSFESLRGQVHYDDPWVWSWGDPASTAAVTALSPVLLAGKVLVDHFQAVEQNRTNDATAVMALQAHEDQTRSTVDTFPRMAPPDAVAGNDPALAPGSGLGAVANLPHAPVAIAPAQAVGAEVGPGGGGPGAPSGTGPGAATPSSATHPNPSPGPAPGTAPVVGAVPIPPAGEPGAATSGDRTGPIGSPGGSGPGGSRGGAGGRAPGGAGDAGGPGVLRPGAAGPRAGGPGPEAGPASRSGPGGFAPGVLRGPDGSTPAVRGPFGTGGTFGSDPAGPGGPRGGPGGSAGPEGWRELAPRAPGESALISRGPAAGTGFAERLPTGAEFAPRGSSAPGMGTPFLGGMGAGAGGGRSTEHRTEYWVRSAEPFAVPLPPHGDGVVRGAPE